MYEEKMWKMYVQTQLNLARLDKQEKEGGGF